MGTDHRMLDTAVAALPGLTEPVHAHVVADIAPTPGLSVKGVNAPDDRRNLIAGVVISAGRVVHHGASDTAGLRTPGPDRLIGPPLLPGVDSWRAGGRHRHHRYGCVGRTGARINDAQFHRGRLTRSLHPGFDLFTVNDP